MTGEVVLVFGTWGMLVRKWPVAPVSKIIGVGAQARILGTIGKLIVKAL